MFGIENFTGFIIAAIILNLTPGVDTMYIFLQEVSPRAGVPVLCPWPA